MLAVLFLPLGLQAIAMAIDEGWYHRRRGLPRWERIGHPIDSATVALAYGWLLAHEPGDDRALAIYCVLAACSCLVVTKDERVHAGRCTPGEHWLHALLFVLHPIVFASFGILWWRGFDPRVLVAQLGLTLAVMLYQVLYWSFRWQRPAKL
jgi:hypothetical protein